MTPKIELYAASRGYDRETCWTQARAAVIPASHPGEKPVGVLTMQRIHLAGSDDFEGIQNLLSTDGGETWSAPVKQAAYTRRTLETAPNLVEEVVCDFAPKWHAASGQVLGTGHTAYYVNGHIPDGRPRCVSYGTYDDAAETWRPWRALALPEEPKFYNAGAGCAQRVDLPNGEILLPIYAKFPDTSRYASTVMRCAFDGEELTYLGNGSEHTVGVGRGLYEPSLTAWKGRFYLTLRNDEAGYVAVSEDGLQFSEPIEWRFDDGSELGNYNTQQHWIAHSSGLYLLYTRRGLNNDHVFRHRAPIVMAQVDPERLCIIRETEIAVIPERGARLGNFGVTEAGPNEFWVTETEWMQNAGEWGQTMLEQLGSRLPAEKMEAIKTSLHLCAAVEQYGSDNTVWVGKVLF